MATIESRIISCQSRHCFQKAVIKRGLRRMRAAFCGTFVEHPSVLRKTFGNSCCFQNAQCIPPDSAPAHGRQILRSWPSESSMNSRTIRLRCAGKRSQTKQTGRQCGEPRPSVDDLQLADRRGAQRQPGRHRTIEVELRAASEATCDHPFEGLAVARTVRRLAGRPRNRDESKSKRMAVQQRWLRYRGS